MNFRAVVRFALATGLAALGVRAATAQAQEAEPQPALFGERVDVEVVNVDVVVRNASGRLVTDLGRDDFELRIDGQPVAIEYYSAPRAAPGSPPARRVESPPVEPRGPAFVAPPKGMIIVFIDQSALEVKASSRILEQVHAFVTPRLDGSVAVMIATFVDALRILAPITTDRATIEAALAELQKIRGRGTILQNERHALEADIRSAMIGAPSDPGRRQRYLAAQRDRLEAEIQAFGERALDRQRRSVAALREWVSALAAIEGRKALLLASNGVSSNPGLFLQSLSDAQLKGSSGSIGIRESFSTSDELAAQAMALNVEFEEMLHAAQNARVAFYTISPRTPPVVQNSAEFGGLGTEVAQAAPRDLALVEAASSVVRMGAATGGANLYLDDGLAGSLERVLADEEAIYSLGFSTGDAAGERDHRIEVRVKRAGMKLAYRESYRRRSLADRAEQALAAAVSLHAVTNPLGVALEVGAPEPEEKRGKGATVPVVVRIPLQGLALVPEAGGLRGRLSARFAILDARGQQRTGAAAPFAIEIAAADEKLVATRHWPYRAKMRLAAGANRVAVVVVDELSGIIATATASVDIPGKGKKG